MTARTDHVKLRIGRHLMSYHVEGIVLESRGKEMVPRCGGRGREVNACGGSRALRPRTIARRSMVMARQCKGNVASLRGVARCPGPTLPASTRKFDRLRIDLDHQATTWATSRKVTAS
jgi:hypothetical protein